MLACLLLASAERLDRLDWRLSESRSCAASGTADGVYSSNGSCAAQQWVKRQGEWKGVLWALDCRAADSCIRC